MESLFEIHSEANYKMIVENARKYGVGPRIPTVVVTGALFVFCVLNSAISGVLGKCWKQYAVIGTLLFFTYFLPNILTALSFRTAKKRNGGVLPSYTVIIAEKFVVKSGEQETVYEFRDLTEILHMKYSYKLRFTGRRTLLIDTNHFTKGSFAEFKAFLRQKRPDLNIPE